MNSRYLKTTPFTPQSLPEPSMNSPYRHLKTPTIYPAKSSRTLNEFTSPPPQNPMINPTPPHTSPGHSVNAGCIRFHPQTDFSDKEGLAMASCAHDGSVCLWSMGSKEPLATVQSHNGHRVSRLSFHPSGRYMATAWFVWGECVVMVLSSQRQIYTLLGWYGLKMR